MELEQTAQINLEQNNKEDFLSSTLWKTINNGIDIGLRYLLPDLIEDEIIDLKDNLINFGLKDGIKQSVDSVIRTGKEAFGIITGNFDNIGQIQNIIKSGGILDKISDILDTVIDKAEDVGKINRILGNTLKNGKSSVLSSIEKNLEATLNNQINSEQKIEKYINNWKNYYNEKDFDGMQKEYKKMQIELKALIPIENTIKNARHVENIHNLIKNNGHNFDLSNEELELAGTLSI